MKPRDPLSLLALLLLATGLCLGQVAREQKKGVWEYEKKEAFLLAVFDKDVANRLALMGSLSIFSLSFYSEGTTGRPWV